MPKRAIAHPACDFHAMAWAPSYRAPKARDVLHPAPFMPPQAPVVDEQPLLDTIINNPDDDAPRQSLAEWYDLNHQRKRASFIRAQLAGELASPDVAWEEVFEPWCARDLVWRRGFVEGMSLSGRSFLTLGEPLFRMTPLRAVRLVAIAPIFDELVACPYLVRLHSLDLRGNHIEPWEVERLKKRHLRLSVIS